MLYKLLLSAIVLVTCISVWVSDNPWEMKAFVGVFLLLVAALWVRDWYQIRQAKKVEYLAVRKVAIEEKLAEDAKRRAEKAEEGEQQSQTRTNRVMRPAPKRKD